MKINCLNFVNKKKLFLAKQFSLLLSVKIKPKLVVISCSSDFGNESYIKNKIKIGHELGVEVVHYRLDPNLNQESVIEIVNKLNNDHSVHGILIQLPLEQKFDQYKILSTIDPKKDVDCLNPINLSKLIFQKKYDICPCTPKGIIDLVKDLKLDYKDKKVCIINRSLILGIPLFHLFLNNDFTPTICHSKTIGIKKIIKESDIIVLGLKTPKFLTRRMVKKNALVIDVSINKYKNKIVGDAHTNVSKKSYLTPVPNGVGPITVIYLFDNLLHLIKKSYNINY